MNRDNNFDLARLLLAYLVLACHSFPVTHDVDPFSRFTRGQIEGGELAVNFFFVISGFLISKSWSRSSGLLDFCLKRGLRIYPGYLCCILFCALVVGPLAPGRPQDYWQQLNILSTFKNALVLGGVLAPRVFEGHVFPFMNISLWTIPYEMGCYALVAGLGVVGLLRNRSVQVWGTLLLGSYLPFCAYKLGAISSLSVEQGTWLRFIVYYSAGAFLAASDRPFYLARKTVMVGSILVLVSAFTAGLQVVLPVAGSASIIYFCVTKISRKGLYKPRFDISYGVYLYAFPIQQLWAAFGVNNPFLLTILTTVILLPLALLSYLVIERPALNLKRVRARPHAMT